MIKTRDTQAEKKIMDFLLDHSGEKLYLSQIAKSSGASVSTCHQVLERKTGENLLVREKLGNLSIYFVDPNNALNRQLKVVRTLELLNPLIEKLKDFTKKIILFGSTAEGTDTPESDIDLFILTSEKDEVQEIISGAKTGRKIQAIIKNFLEFVEMKEKDQFFYEEINKGRVLWEENNED